MTLCPTALPHPGVADEHGQGLGVSPLDLGLTLPWSADSFS